MSDRDYRRFFLVVVLLWTVGPPAWVEAASQEGRTSSVSCRVGDKHHPAANAAGSSLAVRQAVVLPYGMSIGQFLPGGGRTRIVQICTVVMCIALFIMMRKLRG